MIALLPADISPWISYGAPFVSGLVGATLGSVVTWLTAGRKLARERAAERRLEWLEGMHDALVQVLLPIGRAYSQLVQPQPDLPVVTQSLAELLQAMESAQGFRHRARLFASQRAVTTIREAFEKLEDPSTLRPITATTPVEILRDTASRIEIIGNVVMKAREELVHDIRLHLDLPKLAKRAVTMRDNGVRMGLLPPNE